MNKFNQETILQFILYCLVIWLLRFLVHFEVMVVLDLAIVLAYIQVFALRIRWRNMEVEQKHG